MSISPQLRDRFSNIATFIRKKAEEAKLNAAMSGEPHDGGASDLEDQVQAWEAGLEGKVPENLRRYADDMDREDDPDWKKYVALHEKFGGRRP